MTYTILTNDEFYAQEKQDKLDLDLFNKVNRQGCKKMHLVYKLLDKGANPMRFDGDLIKCAFWQAGHSKENLEFLSHCHENYQEVKDYIHNKLDIKVYLAMPVMYLNSLLFVINQTERNLTPQEREMLNNGPANLKIGNEQAIEYVNQAIAKKDLLAKLTAKHLAVPKNKNQTQKLKI